MISNHLTQVHVSKSSSDGSSLIPGIASSPSAGTAKLPSASESQADRQPAVFHNSVYTSSPPKNESQNLEREQGKVTVLFLVSSTNL